MIVSPTPDNLQCCARRLLRGGLVSFPTETVYGLGADATSEVACSRIFAAKGRPRSDPLIVHVCNVETALKLADLTALERQAFIAIGSALWPGPLTLVVRAAARVPSIVTASTGYVGLRVPANSVAADLLAAAASVGILGVAAPSANKFGHISPTTAAHVASEFSRAVSDSEALLASTTAIKQLDLNAVVVLEGGPSHVGIESSVIRCTEVAEANSRALREGDIAATSTVPERSGPALRVELLRPGGTSLEAVADALEAAVRSGHLPRNVSILRGGAPSRSTCDGDGTGAGAETAAAEPGQGDANSVGFVSPGMMLKHYAPVVPAFLVTAAALIDSSSGTAAIVPFNRVYVVDFAGTLRQAADQTDFGGYCDLSSAGSTREASARLYHVLREAEVAPSISAIVLPMIRGREEEALAVALRDRLFRAASGRAAVFTRDGLQPQGEVS